MTNIDDILIERGREYGEFSSHARISQELKEVMANGHGWAELPPDMKEALEMVAHKVARILNGNPRNIDSWDDIAGYVTLVADRLRQVKRAEASLAAKGCTTIRAAKGSGLAEAAKSGALGVNLGRTGSGDPM